jgi:GMP synthase PP-ATPase subunit
MLPIGVMRLNECKQVKETLDKHLGINLTVIDGAELFLSRLKGITEPEKKRKIIGGTCMFAPLNPYETPIAGYLDILT